MAKQSETARAANVSEFTVEGAKKYLDVPNLKLPVIYSAFEFLRGAVANPEKHPTRNIEEDRRKLASYAFELLWQQKDGAELDPAAGLDLAAPGVDFLPLIASAIDARVVMPPEAREMSDIEFGVLDPSVLTGEAVAASAPAVRLYNRM